MDGADAERNSTATRDGPFLSPRSALALAANGLPHERTKSIAPQLLASVGAAQRPRPWLLCDSKPRLVGGRTLPCSATCIFNWRWRLLIPSLVGAQERLSVAPHLHEGHAQQKGRRPKPTPLWLCGAVLISRVVFRFGCPAVMRQHDPRRSAPTHKTAEAMCDESAHHDESRDRERKSRPAAHAS
jgi:hypothetical protein